MVMMAGFDLPSSAIRDQISSAVNLVVQQNRLVDGSRKILQISEITGTRGNDHPDAGYFRVRADRVLREDGKVEGRLAATGNIPRLSRPSRLKGDLRLDMDVFVPKA
jgi:pilus assembly protein CpaF